MTLLLCLLPNLRSFSIAHPGDGDKLLKCIISRIGTLSYREKGTTHALSKLAKANFTGSSCNCFLAFASLPSLRELHGKYIEEYNWNPKSLKRLSGVTSLTLEESTLDCTSVDSLISNIDGLEHFQFSFNGSAITAAEWEPRKIVTSLMENASHSLISVDVTGDAFAGRMGWNSGGDVSIHALEDFDCLKTIRLGSDMLMEPDWDNKLGSIDDVYGGKDNDDGYPGAQLLKDILPYSVETLSVRLPVRAGGASQMLEDLADMKDKGFPNLIKITFEDENDLDSGTERECEKAGITIKHLKGTVQKDSEESIEGDFEGDFEEE